MRPTPPILTACLLALIACKEDPTPPPALQTGDCAADAPVALQTCIADYSAAAAACLSSDGALCGASEDGPAAALDALEETLSGSCAESGLFGLDGAATTARLRAACSAEADSLAWRAFGGPQAALWESSGEQACLSAAHEAGQELVDGSLGLLQDCAGGCDDLDARRADLEQAAASAIASACDDSASILALSPEEFASRTALQVDCAAAASLEDTSALALECGPGFSTIEADRGEWVQVQVDPDQWGAICGDGSDYAFWIRPAPEGARLDRVLVGLQGGGVCVFADDCGAKLAAAPELFTAQDDVPFPLGIASDDPAVSPFHDWTQVYLPYCNQDVFAGGGGVEDFGTFSLPRAGAINLRSALRMTRDFLWREVDAEGGDGFRPDAVVALFGGWSAGAYGTLYNTHWVLDDLQWPRTTAFPDAGLALDNGEALGVRGLGLVKIPVWGTLPFLPPYCFAGDCAVGTELLAALSPRLKQVPEQQVLMVSNQRDQIQQVDAYFQDEALFINTMRADYCDTKGWNGVHWYLTSEAEGVHVVSIREEFWLGAVDGQTMSDWFSEAINSPDTLESRAEEGDFVAAVEGVEAFPCEVAP